MDIADIEFLPTAQRLVLAYMGKAERPKLGAAFALDQRLARIVGSASEPILAQMRIAWWREVLCKAKPERPDGDAVLSSIGERWAGREEPLFSLIDAWEELLLADELDKENVRNIAEKRCAFVEEVMQSPNYVPSHRQPSNIAKRWALADLAAHCSRESERELIVEIARDLGPDPSPLPRSLRGIAVLDALTRHSLKHGGRPLAEGRIGAIIAFRAGLFGR